MCINNPNCSCHHLEMAIKRDKTKELKAVFNSYYIGDQYNFLLDAYKLLEIQDGHKFATGMNKLVENYLLENSAEAINVKNEHIKMDFMSLYDEHIDDLGSARSSLNERLLLLTQDVQFLVYQNLSGMAPFDNCLAKANEESMGDMKNVKSHKRSGCNIF